MMRVRNQPSDCSKDSEGFDFEMGGVWSDILLVQRDQSVVLLITVEIFDQTSFQEMVKGNLLAAASKELFDRVRVSR